MEKVSYDAMKTFLAVTTCVFVLQYSYGFKVTFTTCTEEEPILTVFYVSPATCLSQCDYVDDCETVLYVRMLQLCQLHRREPHITDDSCGQNALLKLTYSKTIIAINTQADVEYCTTFEAGEHAVILGNRQSVGTKRQLTCAKSYNVFGERDILCKTPGVWSKSGECIHACDAPMATENMVFGRAAVELPTETAIYQEYDPRSISWFENSTIVIGCLDDSILLGPPSIMCSDGSWTEYPECKKPTMRQPCQGNDDCVDTNSECRGGTCWCKPELSYNPANMTCVSICQVYGNTFQVVEGLAIKDLNFYQQGNVNREDCMNLCLTYTAPNYVCKHADYVPGYSTAHRSIRSTCFLTENITPLPKAEARSYAIEYLLRDCA